MKLKNLIWYWLGNELKWLWPFKAWSFFKPGIGIVDNKSTVCVEGFPRSGNTFLYALTCQLAPSDKIAHHLHHCGQISEALRLKVPVFFIVRNPSDAISSYVIREEIPMERAIQQYLSLYKFVILNINDIHIISFEELRNNVEAVIKGLSHHFLGTDSLKVDIDKVNSLVADLDRADQGTKEINPLKIGLPNAERDAVKAKVLAVLQTEYSSQLAECRFLYEQLTK